ncbi:MAG: thiamine-phosphate kinase [Thermoplasmatota archaeon]
MKRLSDIGERKAIQLISSILSKPDIAVGIGDDCAALEIGNEYLLVTTDMITQKYHIPEQMTPFQIGWFIVAINLSDIAAKGGRPLGLVLSLGLPKKTSEFFLKQLIKGADSCATSFDTAIIGGDTKETSEITLCGTAFGLVDKNKFLPRKGCSAGDIVAVTGPLGRAGAGYYMIQKEFDDESKSNALFEPVPRLKEGILLAEQKCVTSSMDISDGLSSSLYQLGQINNVGFELYQSDIPIASELKHFQKQFSDINIFDVALHFGGDYELLVTIARNCFEKNRKKLGKKGVSLYPIGSVTSEKDIVIVSNNVRKKIENKGYEHFKGHHF